MQILKAENLVKQFGTQTVVNSLGFTLQAGEVYSFLGPNGAGKSTTIRMLLGLIKPDAGSVQFFEQNLRPADPACLSRIGAMIERPDFYGYLSGYQTLLQFARLHKQPVPLSRIDEVLELTGLSNSKRKPVKTYSQGMKQRLGIAQAILHDPIFLILDEPTNGLDPQGVIDIRNLILHLNRDLGKTILVSSHILSEMEIISTRMLVINKGKKVAEGKVSELLNDSVLQVTFELNNPKKAMELVKLHFPAASVQINQNALVAELSKEDAAAWNALFARHDIQVFSCVPIRPLEAYFLKIV